MARKTLALIATLLLGCQSEPPEYIITDESKRVGMPQVREACGEQPHLPFCETPSTEKADVSTFPSASQIILLDAKARENVVFIKDEPDRDGWRSYEDSIHLTWYGDCDDLTLTVLDLIQHRDASYIALVSSLHNNTTDHMVGIVQDNKGLLWVVGDTFRPAYRLKFMDHDKIYISQGMVFSKWVS